MDEHDEEEIGHILRQTLAKARDDVDHLGGNIRTRLLRIVSTMIDDDDDDDDDADSIHKSQND